MRAMAQPYNNNKKKKEQTAESSSTRSYARLAPAIVAPVSLFVLYLYFLNYFAAPVLLGSMSLIGSLVFYTMILRVFFIAFISPCRRLPVQAKFLVFSLESFLFIVLILAVVFTGDAAYNLLLEELLTAWVGTGLIVLTPYSIYELGVMMYKGTSNTSLAFGATPLVAIVLFLSSLPFRLQSPLHGIESFGASILNSLKMQPTLGETANSTSSSFVSGATIVFFISLLIYIVLQENVVPAKTILLGAEPKYHYVLALVVLGTIIVGVWILACSSSPPLLFRGNLFEIFSIPAVVLSTILWVASREH